MTSYLHMNTQDQVRENIFSEQGRLNTFFSWPHSAAVEPAALAKAGFYYLGQADRVRCAFCTGTLKNWQHGDDPLTEHRKHFGRCRFIQGENVGNIPLEASPGTEAPQPADHVTAPSKKEEPGSEVRSGGLKLNPRHPDFQSVNSRQVSFVDWPPDAVQRPETLVDAGFFFTGIGDGVRCFCCDGALRNWEPSDDPWEEHARWFPRCPYLLQQKGSAFISEVQAKHAAARSAVQSPVAVREESSSVDPLLMSEVARQAVDMGFDQDTVLSALHQHTASSGGQLPSLDLLIGSLLGENELHGTGERSASPLGPESNIGLHPVSGTPFSGIEKQEEGKSDRTLCKICMDREVAVTFLPCGHLVCCSECAKHVKQCPVCRKAVRATIRTYLC